MLAAQYVVGSLAGSARKRFETLLLNDANLRGLVSQWSDRMNTLGANLPQQVPSSDLLPAIKKRLGFKATQKNKMGKHVLHTLMVSVERGLQPEIIIRRWNLLAC